MPVSTLVTTPNSSSANAYVSLEVAEQYHLDRPAVGTTWEDATDEEKNAAILWATKLMDANFVWLGRPATAEQFLGWARSGLLDYNQWNYLDETTIPIQIQWACAEYARQLLASDRAADSDIETQGVTAFKVGPLEFKFREGVRAKPVPDAVAKLIPRHWGFVRDFSNFELERA